jgi:hypothetical protein
MKRLRYYTEQLPATKDPHDIDHISAMHYHSTKHDWVRLDENTIIGIAEVHDEGFHKLLKDHETIVMFPSIHERITVHDHFRKKNKGKHFNHFETLNKLHGVTSSDTTIDMITKLMENGHTMLSPDK